MTERHGVYGTISHGHPINIEAVVVSPSLLLHRSARMCVCVKIGVACVFFDIGCCSKGVCDGWPSEAVESGFGCLLCSFPISHNLNIGSQFGSMGGRAGLGGLCGVWLGWRGGVTG